MWCNCVPSSKLGWPESLHLLRVSKSESMWIPRKLANRKCHAKSQHNKSQGLKAFWAVAEETEDSEDAWLATRWHSRPTFCRQKQDSDWCIHMSPSTGLQTTSVPGNAFLKAGQSLFGVSVGLDPTGHNRCEGWAHMLWWQVVTRT